MFYELSPKGVILRLKVKAGSKRFSFSLESQKGFVKVETKAPPEKGRANTEIENEFGKALGARARIIAGFKSQKKLLLAETSAEKVLQALNGNKA